VNLDYEAVRAAAKEYTIKLSFGKTSEGAKREMLKCELDLDGKQYYKESFKKCDAANTYTTLREGKIYQCPESAYIGIFNEYFNQNLAVSEKDYIDIYKAGSMNEIVDLFNNNLSYSIKLIIEPFSLSDSFFIDIYFLIADSINLPIMNFS
jgi:hypothetical protein